ncbi:glycosyltransferase family 39 protein [Candidatus Woesearchaeota archaeon]|nr:glycosyltransferase family 39 protein [Candidatus Woesearchaeota archaeon]
MPKITRLLSDRRNLVVVLFVVFLFLRLFVSSKSVLLSADSLKFLETAKNFPSHTLYNNELYLLHPPFYPYVIYFFTLIFQDPSIAAIFISLISAVITFFLLYHLFIMLTRNFNITFLILVFFTLSVGFIKPSHAVLRESFVIMLTLSVIYFYVKGVKFDDRKSIAFASILGAILAFTSDHVIFLLPSIIISYIFFNRERINFRKLEFPNLAYLVLPLLLILLFYGSWLSIKFYHYSNSEYYANGYEGMPLNTQDLGFLQLLSPQNFEDYSGTIMDSRFVGTIKRLIFNLGYMFNLEPLSIPVGLNFSTMHYLLFPRHIVYMLLIYLPLAFAALFGFFLAIKNFIKTRQIHNNVDLYITALFLIFLFPVTQKFSSPRYILLTYIFLFYFIGYGLIMLLQKKRKLDPSSKILPVIAILLLLITPFWYYTHPANVFSTKKLVSAQNTADFINANIPEDAGIMAQAGYTVKIIYLTDNRVIGLHHDPKKLSYLTELYDIDYIVTGRFYTEVRGLAKDSAEYIKNNPEKFELIATVQEDYSEFFVEEDLARTDEVYVYKVIKNN